MVKEFDTKKELAKLRRITSKIPGDKRKIVDGIVQDCVFQCEQLGKLREHILENGWSEEYQNGANQYGRKSSIEADYYVKLQKLYAANIKQLTDLMPAEAPKKAADPFEEFLSERDEM